MATSRKQRERQRANRKLGKEDRLDRKTVAGKDDPTPYFAMRNLTRGKNQDPRYI